MCVSSLLAQSQIHLGIVSLVRERDREREIERGVPWHRGRQGYPGQGRGGGGAAGAIFVCVCVFVCLCIVMMTMALTEEEEALRVRVFNSLLCLLCC